MEQLFDAFQVLFIVFGYGGIGAVSGVLMNRVLVTRGESPENIAPASLLAGAFWPVGLFIGIALYYTGPHLPRSVQSELRTRHTAALKAVQELEIQKMELQVEKGRRLIEIEREQMFDAQMRQLNRGRDDTL